MSNGKAAVFATVDVGVCGLKRGGGLPCGIEMLWKMTVTEAMNCCGAVTEVTSC